MGFFTTLFLTGLLIGGSVQTKHIVKEQKTLHAKAPKAVYSYPLTNAVKKFASFLKKQAEKNKRN